MIEYVLFVREALRRHDTTGAVWPSSASLARAITRFVRTRQEPARILEVGPGTGVFTREIVRHMSPEDELVLVEVNPEFVRLLNEKLRTDPVFRRRAECIRVVCDRIEAVPLDGRFDYIVSGLPFNNFSPSLVRAIFRRLNRLARPGGILSFFEYLGLRKLRMTLGTPATRARLREVEAVIRVMERHHVLAHDIVWWNVPPALVRHWRMGDKSWERKCPDRTRGRATESTSSVEAASSGVEPRGGAG